MVEALNVSTSTVSDWIDGCTNSIIVNVGYGDEQDDVYYLGWRMYIRQDDEVSNRICGKYEIDW